MATSGHHPFPAIKLEIFDAIKHNTFSTNVDYIAEVSKLNKVLSRYLVDILTDISREISDVSDYHKRSSGSSSSGSSGSSSGSGSSIVIAKKNPRLLSKYINKDVNVNVIKGEINKLAALNYSIILESVTNILNTMEQERVVSYLELIFTLLQNKCYNESSNIAYYIRFITDIGTLTRYEYIVTALFAKYIKSIIDMCTSDIRFIPEIKSIDSGTCTTKLEYYTVLGMIINSLLCNSSSVLMQKGCIPLGVDLWDIMLANLVLALDSVDKTLQEQRVLILIGFCQGTDNIKLLSETMLFNYLEYMTKLVDSTAIPFKYKFRLMDWYEVLKTASPAQCHRGVTQHIPYVRKEIEDTKKQHKHSVDAVDTVDTGDTIDAKTPLELIEHAQPIAEIATCHLICGTTASKTTTQGASTEEVDAATGGDCAPPVIAQPHITLLARLFEQISGNSIDIINDKSTVSLVYRYIDKYSATASFNDEMIAVYNYYMDAINDSDKKIAIIVQFLSTIHKKHHNIWSLAIANYIKVLSTFNNIFITWVNCGWLLALLVENKLVDLSMLDGLIGCNKKDSKKVCATKLRFLHGMHAIGAKRFTTLLQLDGRTTARYCKNLTTLLEQVGGASSATTVINAQVLAFSKQLAVQSTAKVANRFELLNMDAS
jgi:hypothetical protein